MATEKPVFDSTEKTFIQAAIALKIAQINRQIAAEIDPDIIDKRKSHVDLYIAIQTKIRSM